jgi:dihydrofolate reductase
MQKLRFRISMSLDGFVAGSQQSIARPLGIGGEQLHEWVFPLAVWRAMHGLEGGEVNESTAVIEESRAGIGATIMGRNMFGGHPGRWREEHPWSGWWGSNPPYQHPVIVLTHFPREPLQREGGTTFYFVTGGIEAALWQARELADGLDVALAGGALAARQYLKAGLVDEMEISLAPVFLGAGEQLFDGLGESLRRFIHVRTIAAPGVTHHKFVRG